MSLQQTQLLLWDTVAKPTVSVRLAIDLTRFRPDEFNHACEEVDNLLSTLPLDFPGATITQKYNNGRTRIVRINFADQRSAEWFVHPLMGRLAVHLDGREKSIPITTRIETT